MLDGFLGAWIRLRARWRGWELPFFALPLLPAALVNAFAGEERAVVGCLLGFGATILAGRILRRGRMGDARRAAWVAPPRPVTRGYTRLYQEHVTQAHEGCDFDFLQGDAPSPEPSIF